MSMSNFYISFTIHYICTGFLVMTTPEKLSGHFSEPKMEKFILLIKDYLQIETLLFSFCGAFHWKSMSLFFPARMSSSSFLSPPPSPHTAPLPLSSSSVICCPELDLSVTLGSPQTGHAHVKPSSLKIGQQRDQSQPKPLPQGPTGRGANTRVMTLSF